MQPSISQKTCSFVFRVPANPVVNANYHCILSILQSSPLSLRIRSSVLRKEMATLTFPLFTLPFEKFHQNKPIVEKPLICFTVHKMFQFAFDSKVHKLVRSVRPGFSLMDCFR